MSAPRLAILVASPEEARRALRSGADFVLAPARRERPAFGVPERLQTAAGPQLHYAVSADESLPSDPRPVARIAAPADLAALRGGGYVAALLDPERALLRAFSLDALADFVAACRRAGLECWLGGALELPDVPRLRVIEPDALVFEALDEEGMRGARAMLVPEVSPSAPTRIDTVRVRDLVVSMRIGAYRFEQDRSQRVRFNLEIDVRRPVVRPLAMEDVYSYDLVLDAIRRLTETGHVALVETLAEDLATAVLQDPRVETVRARVEKLDLGPEAVGIEIRRTRSDLTS